jgi:hypothetical protein
VVAEDGTMSQTATMVGVICILSMVNSVALLRI